MVHAIEKMSRCDRATSCDVRGVAYALQKEGDGLFIRVQPKNRVAKNSHHHVARLEDQPDSRLSGWNMGTIREGSDMRLS